MKFNICGYNQKSLIKYELDGNDAILLRTIMDIYSSSSNTIDYIILDNDKYMWLTYGYLFEQVQILGSVRTIIRKIEKLIEKNILKKVVLNSKNGKTGKYMYLAPDKNYAELTTYEFYKQNENDYEENHQMPNEPTQMSKCHNPYDKMETEDMTNCHIKDSSITDYSIKNNNITHTGENPSSLVENIFEKYKELNLPEYIFRPSNHIILNCINSLGINNIFKALEMMSRSSFVKKYFSVNTIFKIENLKKAINGAFKDREKIYRDKSTHLNITDDKVYEVNPSNEELYRLLGLR